MNELLHPRIWDTPPEPFDAQVMACEPKGARFETIVSRTCFYPEGGGQPGDRGTLGSARVLTTRRAGGEIVHETDAQLTVGDWVHGEVDAAFRADVTRQHTGEHTLSGTLHRLFGAENVGFHIGETFSTMDTSIPLTANQLSLAEREANAVVLRDEPVRILYPPREKLSEYAYRSKKEIEGEVRLLQVPGADLCACCGTHVSRTGQIGTIYIASAIHYKAGMRLTLLCGERALNAACAARDSLREAGALLSASGNDIPAAIRRTLEERDALRARLADMERGLIRHHAAQAAAAAPAPYVFYECLSPAALKRAVVMMAETGIDAVGFAPDGARVHVAIAARAGAADAVKRLAARFGGRGGGKNELAQGVLDGGTANELCAAALKLMNDVE